MTFYLVCKHGRLLSVSCEECEILSSVDTPEKIKAYIMRLEIGLDAAQREVRNTQKALALTRTLQSIASGELQELRDKALDLVKEWEKVLRAQKRIKPIKALDDKFKALVTQLEIIPKEAHD